MSLDLTAYRKLDWDSTSFGFGVAAITDPAPPALRLHATLAHLRSEDIALVYWCAADDRRSAAIARGCNGTMVATKITYASELSQRPASKGLDDVEIVEYLDRTSCTELDDLAIESGYLSRFRADPRFPREKFELLYRTWIAKSVSREIADAVLVARGPGGRIAGFVTVGESAGRSDIGLVAVSKEMRGRSIGRALVRAAEDWALTNSYETGQVVTQGENVAACRLYERCGYEVERVGYWYHFWLDNLTERPDA